MPSRLFEPIAIGAVELPNRLVVAPMCQYSASDGSATDWHLQHLSQLAYSGAGLVVVEATPWNGVVVSRTRVLGCTAMTMRRRSSARCTPPDVLAVRRDLASSLLTPGAKLRRIDPGKAVRRWAPPRIPGRPYRRARLRSAKVGTCRMR